MPKPSVSLSHSLSLRLSLWVVTVVAILFVATLSLIYHFSHKALKEEAVAKATMTLDETVLEIDLVLHKVEITAKDLHWNVRHQLGSLPANPSSSPGRGQSDGGFGTKITSFCRQTLESNPSIIGSIVALEESDFITYVYRKDASNRKASEQTEILQVNHYGQSPYREQNWYTIVKERDTACWVRPYETEANATKIVSYCIPLHKGSFDHFTISPLDNSSPKNRQIVKSSNSKIIGVLGVDISLDWFSPTITNTKPFAGSYCTMIGRRGTYIIHPDTMKMSRHSVYELAGKDIPGMDGLLRSMMNGESDYREVELDGRDCYVFYKPFHYKGWVAALVCPTSDMLAESRRLLRSVTLIAVVGLVALLLFCLFIIGRAMRPLGLLGVTAMRLAAGNYNAPIPDTRRSDEIGSLQNSFQSMQQSIATYLRDIRQINDGLFESNEALATANRQAQEAERVMGAFLSNMSDQLIKPVTDIEEIVGDVCRNYGKTEQQEVVAQVEKVERQSEIVTDLLDRMLLVAQE